jgi:type II secretion system protein C
MRRNWIKYLNFFLSFIVIFLLVNTFFFLKSYGKEKEKVDIPSILPPAPSFEKSEKSLADYSVIYKRNLFNLEEAPKAMPSTQSLSLKLKGTVVGVEEFTFCIIEDKTKRQEDLYQIGDKIQDMEITDITANSVVLSRGRERLVLYIEEEEIKESGRIAAVEPTYPDLTDIEQASENKWIVSREDVLQATENVSKIMSDFKISPYFSSGKIEGFKIDDIKDGSIASLVGIKKGDIVKKVNGEAIDSPKKIFELYRSIDRASAIQLEVDRDGATEVLTYEIKP